jgi:hypothetical protein
MADNRRERRPLGQHAGEVTKKKNRYATNDGYGQVAPLPPPSASQNGRSRHHNSRLGPGASINGDDNPDEDSGAARMNNETLIAASKSQDVIFQSPSTAYK